ncbi:hypothetical protein C2G38_2038702 [Gigaspora rosea]|uniref:Uncharacterized protein n=1 Tax=Gigaspora rosea TaxID=44941 RepID=A0A397VAG3_9GLOM|nr:hypothetical protein C2G38_2038702 [Gigaspora rosea]
MSCESDNNYDSESESDTDLHQSAINKLRWFSNDLESLFKEGDTALDKSVFKFVKIYKKRRFMQNTHIRPAITSFLETCNWNAGRVNGNTYQRGGKRIKVQVAAAARCKEGSTRTLNKILQGRPPKENKENNMHKTKSQEEPSRFIMPARSKRRCKKCPHDLNQALKEIRPNGY